MFNLPKGQSGRLDGMLCSNTSPALVPDKRFSYVSVDYHDVGVTGAELAPRRYLSGHRGKSSVQGTRSSPVSRCVTVTSMLPAKRLAMSYPLNAEQLLPRGSLETTLSEYCGGSESETTTSAVSMGEAFTTQSLVRSSRARKELVTSSLTTTTSFRPGWRATT